MSQRKPEIFDIDESGTIPERHDAPERELSDAEKAEGVREYIHSVEHPKPSKRLWSLIEGIPARVCRILLISLLGAFAAFLILYNCCLVTPFSCTLDGLMLRRGDDASAAPIRVSFDGELTRFIFKGDYFTGTLSVEGFEYHRWPKHSELVPDSAAGKNLKYYYAQTFFGRSQFPAGIELWSADEQFKLNLQSLSAEGFETGEPSIVWGVSAKTAASNYGWNSQTGWYIVCPASTPGEAEQAIIREIWRYNRANPQFPIAVEPE